MNREALTRTIFSVLHRVAPEVDLEHLDPERDLRDALDIDSMDVFRVMVGLHDALGVDIPERDVSQLRTLHACLDYLEAALRSKPSPGHGTEVGSQQVRNPSSS